VSECAGSADYEESDELRAALESKRRRRETLVETIKRAGINPAEIDVTMIASDEEQAKLLQQMAERKEAHLMAERFGREALRARLKRTIETASRNGTCKPSKNGTKPHNEPEETKSDIPPKG
jgi:hypothetical protein